MGVCCSRKKAKVKSTGFSGKRLQSTLYGGSGLIHEREADKTEVPQRLICYVKMANAISNIKMTNPIKNLVSKRRRRYVQDGYNLDLTYIRKDLIAMGFPAEKLESVYRNSIDDVVKFLESKHKDHYKIYNLCSERTYDDKKFKSRVATFPFDDHNPPNIELIAPFCEDVHRWLSEDSLNVAVVHCKAGKGRTGVMICCYLLHCNHASNAPDALDFYGKTRTEDRKGVTIPSQRRYVAYYENLLRKELKYEETNLVLYKVHVSPPPIVTHQACYQLMVSSSNGTRVYESPLIEVKRSATNLVFSVNEEVRLTGDVKVEFVNRPKMKRKEKMFHFWFNTFFVSERIADEEVSNGNEEVAADRSQRARSYDATGCGVASGDVLCEALRRPARSNSLTSVQCSLPYVLRLSKHDLDKAHKDKQDKIYPPNFEISLYFRKVPRIHPEMAPRPPLPTPPPPSESDESDSDEENWDSDPYSENQ